MSKFSIRNPYFIIVLCLTACLLGVVFYLRMPVDLFPDINIPQVIVATFYSGMPPQDIETDITSPLERFFTLAGGIDHMESHSILGVSIIKVFFQPGTNADSDVTQISNLALADLKRLPPGTLPPVVLKSDASSLPVCLVGVKGPGLTETQLQDYARFAIRNQIAVIKGATIPTPFGGKQRQIMVWIDPYKLSSRELGVMDVVNAVNNQSLILPAGDVKMGPFDYYVYSNSLVDNMRQLNDVPVKSVDDSWVRVSDIGKAEDSAAVQYNIVRVGGQKSTYIPIMKQGGDTNTIQVVDDVKKLIGHLYDIPKQMSADVLFDQSAFVKEAIKTVMHEGLIGSGADQHHDPAVSGKCPRHRSGAALHSALRSDHLRDSGFMGATVNTMILGGLALAFSRVIDNSVISLENIYRHLEEGQIPMLAAEIGGAGSHAGGAGRDAGRCGRLLPGHLSLRRQQVPVLRSGAGILHLAAGVVRGRHDRDSAVLLAVPESCSGTDMAYSTEVTGGQSRHRPEESVLGRAIQRGFQPPVQSHAGYLRTLGARSRCGSP